MNSYIKPLCDIYVSTYFDENKNDIVILGYCTKDDIEKKSVIASGFGGNENYEFRNSKLRPIRELIGIFK